MNGGLIPLIIAVVVVMAFRVRRTMREQPYRSGTVWTRLVLLGVLGLFVLLMEARSVVSMAGVAGGMILGLILGGLSLRHTRFDVSQDPPRYQTNPYIGAIVVTLFAVRVLYDAEIARSLHPHGAVNPVSATWLSGLLYFLFVVYWVVYYIGVIRTMSAASKD